MFVFPCGWGSIEAKSEAREKRTKLANSQE